MLLSLFFMKFVSTAQGDNVGNTEFSSLGGNFKPDSKEADLINYPTIHPLYNCGRASSDDVDYFKVKPYGRHAGNTENVKRHNDFASWIFHFLQKDRP